MVEDYVDIDKENAIQVKPNMKQIVSIYNCQNAHINIKTKPIQVLVEKCKECIITFEDNIIGNLNLINLDKTTIDIKKEGPLIDISRCTNSHIWMTEDNAKKVQIYSAKSDSMNIHYFPAGSDEPIELALPEQIVVTLPGLKVTNTVKTADD